MIKKEKAKASRPCLLLFPIDKEECREFAATARTLGFRTVAASSESHLTLSEIYDSFVHLPYITDQYFDTSLNSVLREYKVTHIFTPHHAVWAHLKGLRSATRGGPSFNLCDPHPSIKITMNYSSSPAFYNLFKEFKFDLLFPAVSELASEDFYGGLHHLFLSTPGESDELKLALLCQLFRYIPDGNIVEIGSLYGRTAVTMSALSSAHGKGSVVCIDPWRNSALRSQGHQANLADLNGGTIDFEKVFKIFLSNAALLRNIGYLRDTSDNALNAYNRAVTYGKLRSPGLEKIAVAKEIALLHIDGNHEFEQVKRDIKLWSPHIAPGGWLLIDDYKWSFGDGPRKAADDELQTGRYDVAFVWGDTLCMRKERFFPYHE